MLGRVLLTIACIGLVACSSSDAKSKSKVGPPVVKLLDPGTGTKTRLRMKAVEGWKQKVVMKMNMTMAMDAGPAMHIPRTELPVMVMKNDVTVSKVEKNGNAHYDLVLTDLDVEPGNSSPNVVASVRASLAKMKGFKGHATVDPRNFTIDGSFDVPPGVDSSTKQMLDSMTQSISQLSAPLPEEPVGVGARWSVAVTMPTTSVTLQQTAEYLITKLDGDQLSMKVTIKQTAEPQDVDAPGMPSGTKLRVTSWKGTGGGDVDLDLGKQLLPTRTVMTIEEHAKFLIDTGDAKQDMSMDMEIGLTL
jgi:hypothetical protein